MPSLLVLMQTRVNYQGSSQIESFWGIIKSEMYQMYEIIDEVSLRYAIKDYLRFYSEELVLEYK